MCSYRFWWRAVVLAECLIFRNIRIEIVHLRTIMNSVSQAPNHQVLPGEGLQHGHLLLLGRLITWNTEQLLSTMWWSVLTWAPGHGDSSQLWVREPDEECSNFTGFQELFSLLTRDEAEESSEMIEWIRLTLSQLCGDELRYFKRIMTSNISLTHPSIHIPLRSSLVSFITA